MRRLGLIIAIVGLTCYLICQVYIIINWDRLSSKSDWESLKVNIDSIDSKLELVVNQHPTDIQEIRNRLEKIEEKVDILIAREDVWAYRKRK
jgi:hypothetical protein